MGKVAAAVEKMAVGKVAAVVENVAAAVEQVAAAVEAAADHSKVAADPQVAADLQAAADPQSAAATNLWAAADLPAAADPQAAADLQAAGSELAAQLAVHLPGPELVAAQLPVQLAGPELVAAQLPVQRAVQFDVQLAAQHAVPQSGACALEQHIHLRAIHCTHPRIRIMCPWPGGPPLRRPGQLAGWLGFQAVPAKAMLPWRLDCLLEGGLHRLGSLTVCARSVSSWTSCGKEESLMMMVMSW